MIELQAPRVVQRIDAEVGMLNILLAARFISDLLDDEDGDCPP